MRINIVFPLLLAVLFGTTAAHAHAFLDTFTVGGR